MISYAGVDLLEPDESQLAWVKKNIDPAKLWSGRGLTRLGFQPIHLPDVAEINTLWWPTGAARFAIGWYLVDEGKLDEIREQTIVDGGTVEADLVLADGTDTLTIPMWNLPAIPLQQTDTEESSDGLYLLPLVDERYFWWFRAAAIEVEEGSTTWTALFAAIAEALNITLTVDTVDADYLYPAAGYASQYGSLPVLLDSVASATGRRIVRQFNGDVRAWSPTNALTQQAASILAIGDKAAGGLLSLSTDGDDNPPNVPETVTVVFRRSDSGAIVATRHAEEVALADLSLTQYGDTEGFEGTKTIQSLHIAEYPGPSNAAELTALAEQAATDWYLWQLARVNLSIVGYPGWTITGLDDAIELRHEPGQVYTRILHGEYEGEPPILQLQISDVIIENAPLTVQDDNLVPPVLNVTDIRFKANEFIVTKIADHIVHIRLGCKVPRRIAGPPPWVAPADACCDEHFYDGTYDGFYNCEDDTFNYRCPCLPLPPSGQPKGDCEPGTCVECDEAPWRWTVAVAGFTGECEVFNGDWLLLYVGPCTWKAGVIVSGVGVAVTLTLDGGGNTLTFEGYSAAGEIVSATYTNDASDLPDCCVPLVFDSDVCDCDAPDALVWECENCTDTPTVWYLELSDFTGCFERFNNPPDFAPWVLTQDPTQKCVWGYAGNGIEITWDTAVGGSLRLIDTISGATAAYVSGVVTDCCSNIVANKVLAQCPVAGLAPGTVTLSPHCSGSAGSCPATLTATPICCTDEPPDEPVCECTLCPLGAPPRWRFRQVACTGDFYDANGDWFLAYSADCTWTQTRGAVTCTLEYDAVLSQWELLFENGDSYELMTLRSFNCCGPNRFHISEHSGIGHTDDFADLLPDGPCTPCDGGGGTIPCGACPSRLIPETLYATPDGSGGCACMDAVGSVALAYNAVNGSWEGIYTGCGGVVSRLRLSCTMLGWRLGYYDSTFTNINAGCCWSGVTGGPAEPLSVDCGEDLEFTFPAFGLSPPTGCCLGQITWTVTAV